MTASVSISPMKSARKNTASSQLSSARAWALRGELSSSARSPKNSPGDSSATTSTLVSSERLISTAGHDQVQRLAFLALVEDDFLGQVAAFVHQAVDDFQFEWRQRREQRRLLEFQAPRRQGGGFQKAKHAGRSVRGK